MTTLNPGIDGVAAKELTGIDGHAAYVGILAAYDGAQDHSAVVEPAGHLFGQIRRYGPTRENPFIWYRV